jgi:carboxylate-amine ligase
MPSTETFSLGVEEEYQLIDPRTRELCPLAEEVMQEAQKTLGKDVQLEIQLSQIEVATPICSSLAEVRTNLAHLRSSVIDAATQFGAEIAASGTHPFSLWHQQSFTPKDRYLALERDFQQLAREQAIFGCHVHVGISNRELGLQIMNHARTWLAPLIALTANSPYWCGRDTGYACYRIPHWGRWPQSGLPGYFKDLAEYDGLLHLLTQTQSIDDPTKIYWDIRLSERFPTIEVRVTDVCTTLDEAVMATGLVRALIHTCYNLVMCGRPAEPIRGELLRIAHWRAARYGLEGDLLDVHAQEAVHASHLIERFLAFLRPALQDTGDWDEVSGLINKTLREGNGAIRQRRAYQQRQRLEDVVEYVMHETARGTDSGGIDPSIYRYLGPPPVGGAETGPM